MAQYGWQDTRPMGPPDENWTLPSWATNSTTEEPPSSDILSGAPAMATALPSELETPAAAAEFSNQGQNVSRQMPPTPVQPVSSRKAQPDSPSVFDIGLSDATIKMFVNKAKPQIIANPSPLSMVSKAQAASASSTSRTSSRVTTSASNMATTYLSSSASSKAGGISPTINDQAQGLQHEHDSTVGASPELQLRSALPCLQVFLQFC